MNDEPEDKMMREYIRLRMKEHCGHREASRRAGYKALASKRAMDCYKFVSTSVPRPRSNDPDFDEIMEFLLLKLKLLNEKMEGLKAEVIDVKMKIRALNLIK
jgi:hypothetical protein